jgi:thioredoxin reductase (NADPH)
MAALIRIAGYNGCGAFRRANAALLGLQAIFPDKFQIDTQDSGSRDAFQEWLQANRDGLGVPNHRTSPLVWFDNGVVLGGKDDTVAWAQSLMSGGSTDAPVPQNLVDQFDPGHDFQYDLLVIGGGSGGLACAKEAASLNPDLRIALCDFVKPSPQGSKWGLGGTCVNVGCIPKKLMHTAALMGDLAQDATAYGWKGGNGATHSWDTMVQNVQDHIKSLNFGYRVELREKGINYLNKLAKFKDPHTVEVTDKKGTKEITAARIVIAVGGRPSPLDVPGGELAITSDDLFSLKDAPGKTCIVGAGYVALECAGFIRGLRQSDVTVLVRSILLRGFDRDMVERVGESLTAHGVNLKQGVLPESVTKLESGRLLVKMSNGEEDEFDTVMVATGRYADTGALNVEGAGVEVNVRNGKIPCVHEQTNVPHIYAIGDVVDGVPELTPAAIQAGILLARRMFSNSKVVMNYSEVATAVFTPLELGTVGLSEERAIEKYGEGSVDCVLSQFAPLEWTVAEDFHQGVHCMAKIVINTQSSPVDPDVVGIHIASPNAGEIMQGLAVAFRKGLKLSDLQATVGIHPTVAEEFTTMKVLKSSGASTQKAGC